MKSIDTKPVAGASPTPPETVRIIMQPGEPSASSHQCGGGPHTSDFEAPTSPQVLKRETWQEAKEGAARYVGARVVSFAGTETSWSELPKPVKTFSNEPPEPPFKTFSEYWAYIPA